MYSSWFHCISYTVDVVLGSYRPYLYNDLAIFAAAESPSFRRSYCSISSNIDNGML